LVEIQYRRSQPERDLVPADRRDQGESYSKK
jgi:hypothetical protein